MFDRVLDLNFVHSHVFRTCCKFSSTSTVPAKCKSHNCIPSMVTGYPLYKSFDLNFVIFLFYNGPERSPCRSTYSGEKERKLNIHESFSRPTRAGGHSIYKSNRKSKLFCRCKSFHFLSIICSK